MISKTYKNKYINSKPGAFLPGAGKTESEFNIDKEFLVKKELFVRVYICTAMSLPSLDDGSLSDPYIQIKLGKTIINVSLVIQ